jgi:glycosyltransferase involved in cell wall biosynthesis
VAPKVSCVITAYNVERWIGHAIDSALAQDWPAESLEVIVVNDGSTDGTKAAIAAYGDRVRLIGKPNGGVVSATNAALEVTDGDYVALLDGDDTWPADKLRVQVPLLEANPGVGLVHGDMRVVAEDGTPVHESFFRYKQETPPRGRVLGKLLHGNFVNGGASVVRASLRERFHPIPDGLPYQDWYIAARVAEVAEIDYVDACVNDYRFHGANQSLGATGDKLVEAVRRDVPWQRWMLRNLDLAGVSVEDLGFAVEVMLANARGVAGHCGTRASELLAVSETERAESRDLAERAADALARGATDLAVRTWVRALAIDPWNGAARVDLAAAAVTHATRPPAPAPQPALDARATVIVAFADELLRDRELLASFGAAFDAGDDVTLVVQAPTAGFDATARRLATVAEEVGLAGEDSADLLVHPCDRPDELVAERARAVLTREPAAPVWAHVTRVDERSLAELRWRAAQAPTRGYRS